MNCPACAATPGTDTRTGGSCAACGGSGQVPTEFPFLYYYPFNMTVVNQGVPANTQPTLQILGAPPNSQQLGTNPITLKLGADNPFRWLFNMISCRAPNIVGDARQWLALYLTDTSSGNWPFMSAPIVASLFAGDADYPFPLLEPMVFGEDTQLQLTGYPIIYNGLSLVFGIGDAATVTFSAVLNAPLLPGSVVVTDPTGIITGSDSGGGGAIVGTGITGTVNYTTGELSVTYAVAPAVGANPTATYNQGPSQLDAQFALSGYYLKGLSAAQVSSAMKNGML
jgi:hypothetical protein